MVSKAISKLKSYGELVMFSHSIFSLPFGIMAMLWASDGKISFYTLFFILLALLGARNGANAFNRVADRKIDKQNARTANRHLPSGKLSKNEAVWVTVFCFAVLAFSAYKLNWLCLALLPVAIFFMLLYSYTKRFTFLCHLMLGFCCGMAPVGAWIAITGEITLPALYLGAVVTAWIAGFDIIYALQDIEFDRKNKINSIPAKFGAKGALYISGALHIAACALLFAAKLFLPVGIIYYIGVILVTALIIVEHISVHSQNSEKKFVKKKIEFASYTINQIVGIVFLCFSLADFFI